MVIRGFGVIRVIRAIMIIRITDRALPIIDVHTLPGVRGDKS